MIDYRIVTAAELRRAARRVAEATATRDRIIRDLHAQGWTLRAIAEHAGMTHAGVKKIIDKTHQ